MHFTVCILMTFITKYICLMQSPKINVKLTGYIKTSYIIATVSIKQNAVDRIKTTLQFWFNAKRISARLTSKSTTFVM